MNKCWLRWVLFGCMSFSVMAGPERYKLDMRDRHAVLTFRVQHLGFSWLEGHFQTFDGFFVYDPDNPKHNHTEVVIDLNSLDTGHAERDRHLKSSRYFNVRRYPKAVFTSTAWIPTTPGHAQLQGILRIRGLKIPVTLDVTEMRSGRDPWGGFRRGFEASGVLRLSDFQMDKAHVLGQASENIRLWLSVEGVRE